MKAGSTSLHLEERYSLYTEFKTFHMQTRDGEVIVKQAATAVRSLFLELCQATAGLWMFQLATAGMVWPSATEM